jgi:hypothetical protein
MLQRTDIWQVEGNLVYKLKNTGKFTKVEEGFEPSLTNEYSMLVHESSANINKMNEAANKIAEILNKNPEIFNIRI